VVLVEIDALLAAALHNVRPQFHIQLPQRRTMWIFTKYGFFSAVCARTGDGRQSRPVDPDTIMVRARTRDHLDALTKRFADLLAACEVKEFAGTDYRYRLFVPKSQWREVVSRLADETDYDNFKSEVARHQGGAGAAYQHSLHKVWSVVRELQK
jgi:hypothetical protein